MWSLPRTTPTPTIRHRISPAVTPCPKRLPTLNDFRLCLRLSTLDPFDFRKGFRLFGAYDFRLLKNFQTTYDYGWHTRWHTRILDRAGWAARKQDRKPGKPCPSTVPGWFRVGFLVGCSVFRFSLFRFSVLYMLFFGLVWGLKSLEIARKYIYISENKNRVKPPKNGLKMQARFPGCWWAGFSILFPGFYGLFRACLVGLVGWCIIRKRKARKTGLQAGFPGKVKPGCFARFTSGFIS